MRILALHLRAYGHFTGYSLDFGAGPGLHLIYGHNEAGKSTTLRALSSVLFGYPHAVVDGFKHDAKDIAIGTDLLGSDGRALSFVRRRRGKHALTAADGSALDDGTIDGFLGGVSREVFEKVFALDHHRLHEHAKALLADGGSLGFSLAEAGSGIAGLKAVLDKLKAERATLFLAGGSKPKLNHAIAEVIELRKGVRRRTVSPTDYRTREKRIEEADAELRKMREQRKTIESNIVRLQRIGKNLPLRAEHRALTLGDAVKKLIAQSATAREHAETAARALNKARNRAAQSPKPRPINDLARALTAADKLGDITVDIAKRTRALERQTKELNETIHALGLGSDRISGARQLAVPS